jgi:hypothetical protein
VIRHGIIFAAAAVLIYFGVLDGSGRVIAWYQKYQAQQDWYAAHGGKHEDHKQ